MEKKWKSLVQIIEEGCIPENNGKREKQSECKTCVQPKRL